MRCVVSALIVLLVAFGGANGAGKPSPSNDDTSTTSDTMRYTNGNRASGAKIYKRYCRGCHGKDGRGGAHTFMPHIDTLTKKKYIEPLPDSFLYFVIAEGGPAAGKNSYMPAWKETLSEQQIIDVITHIRAMPTY